MYLGGLATDVTVGYDSVATETPYIGCMRDVLMLGASSAAGEEDGDGEQLVDFATGVVSAPGVRMGQCKVELPAQSGEWPVRRSRHSFEVLFHCTQKFDTFTQMKI